MTAPARAMSVEKRTANDEDYVAPVIETQEAFATEFEVPGCVTLSADGREVDVSLGSVLNQSNETMPYATDVK